MDLDGGPVVGAQVKVETYLVSQPDLRPIRLEEARMASEALLVSLADAGVRTRAQSLPLKVLSAPMSADLRLSFINLVHPQAPAIYVGTDGRLNVGHHHDPALPAPADSLQHLSQLGELAAHLRQLAAHLPEVYSIEAVTVA